MRRHADFFNPFQGAFGPIQAEPLSSKLPKRQDKIGKKIERAPDQDQAKLEALALLESSLTVRWRAEDKWAGDILILREAIGAGRREGSKTALYGQEPFEWTGPGVLALRNATQPPEGMAETSSKHIALINRRHFEWLQGGKGESKKANPQSDFCQGVTHNQLGKKLAPILHQNGREGTRIGAGHAEQNSGNSSGQGGVHPLGGLVGVAEYEGDLGEFIPFLEAAE